MRIESVSPRPVPARGVRVSGAARLLIALAAGALLLALRVPAAHAQSTLSAFEDDVDRIAKRARPCIVTVIAQRNVSRVGSPVRPDSQRQSSSDSTAMRV